MEKAIETLKGLSFNELKKSAMELLKTPLLPNGKNYKAWNLYKDTSGKTYSLILGWDRFQNIGSEDLIESKLAEMVYGDKYGFDCIYLKLGTRKGRKIPRFMSDWNLTGIGNSIINDNYLKSLLSYFKSFDFIDDLYEIIDFS